MRFLVFLLGVLGSVAAGGAGLFWLLALENRELLVTARDAGVNFDDFRLDPHDPAMLKAAYFLIGGAALGLLGCLFALLRRGVQAAILLLLAAVGPAVFNPATLAVTSPLVLAGLLGFFVRPRPVAA